MKYTPERIKKVSLKALLSLAFLIGFQSLQAQCTPGNKVRFSSFGNERFIDHITIEAGWGLNVPYSPTGDFRRRDFVGIMSFYGGARYAFDSRWSVRGTYGYNEFKNEGEGLRMHKVMAEVGLNLIETFMNNSMVNTYNNFDVMAHAGVGMSFGRPKQEEGVDKMGTIQAGLMPIYKINDRWSIQFDGALVFDFSRDRSFSGQLISKTMGSYLFGNIGIAYKL